ncbi:MAG: sigma-70 family RNA polymerase sigma factor [Planctomycetota bacterium]
MPNHTELLAHLGWIRELARNLVGDQHLAEDLAQDTCVVALQRRPHDRSRLRQWLASILRNFARQQARSSRSRARREQTAGATEPEPSILDSLERASMQHQLIAAVLKLNEVYRTTVLLRFFDGLPQREIARRMNTTAATVNSRLTRALTQLRRDLDHTHGGRGAWIAALVPLLTRPLGLTNATLGILLMNKLKLTVVGLCAAGLVAALLGVFDTSNPTHIADPTVPAQPLSGSTGTARGSSGDSLASASRREVLQPAAREGVTATNLFAEGRVLHADGGPAAGIAVRLQGSDPQAPTATSDATGRFKLAVAGSGNIVACSPKLVTVLAGAYGATSTIEPVVVVAPALSLAGRVANAEGQLLESAHLRLFLPEDFERRFSENLDRSKTQRWESRTDAQGNFTLEGVPQVGGSYVRASLEPYVPEVVGSPQYSDHRMYIVLGRTRAEGALLRGRVVDPEGSIVARARVATGLTSQVTDEKGEFEIELRRAGKADRIVAVKQGYIPAIYKPQSRIDDEPQWPPFVELRLQGKALAISGRVLDLDGKPVPNALVWALDTTSFGNLPVQLEFMSAGGRVPPGEALELPVIKDDKPAPVSNKMDHAKAPSVFWYYESTDADGRFTLPGLMQHSYRLRAMHPRTALTATSSTIAAGSTGVTIRMPADATHALVSGQILTEEGEALKGIHILQACDVYNGEYRLEKWNVKHTFIRHGPRTQTNAKGRFTFRNVPKDRIYLSIYGDAILPSILKLSTLGDPAKLNITVRARYHLEVVLDDPATADTIAARDGVGNEVVLAKIRSGSHDQRGEVQLRNGRSGVLAVGGRMRTLLLLKGGKVVAEVPVALTPGETTVVRR